MTAKKALIVDDSRLAQFVLKKMLVEEKLEVDTTASAQEAFDYLKQASPDIIFLDHTMPGMNGLDALRIIKNDPATAAIPVMMYTSQEDRAYMHQARKMGAIAVLPKQLKPEELQQALRRLDDNHTAKVAAHTPKATTAPPPSESLEQLVYDAEEALKYETWQQKMQHQFQRQKHTTEQELNRLNGRVETLLDQHEKANNNQQNFWNNLLWLAIYTATIVLFSVVFFQQKHTIAELSELIAGTQATSNGRSTITPAAATATTPVGNTANNFLADTPSAAGAAPATATTNTAETRQPANISSSRLRALENILNTDNQVPFGELLLGPQVQELLEEIITPLKQANFRGIINIMAHDGDFCLSSDSDGKLLLPPDDMPISSCQITAPNTHLADIASSELTQFIAAENSADIRFELAALGSANTLEAYPNNNDNITAGLWNNIALSNRRVEITFTERP
ncbi:MAG: response regulator [Cellvibrionaceae bacterium]|nr:response regulator [Cellvibrionaceae bacterium]